MTDRDKKEGKALSDDSKNHPSKSTELPTYMKQNARRLMKISPLGYRVVVRLVKDDNMTETGLYLPEGSKQSMQESLLAEVVEVASAIDEDTHDEANVSGIPLGAMVLIPKGTGITVPWDESLRVIETKHILAIIDSVDII